MNFFEDSYRSKGWKRWGTFNSQDCVCDKKLLIIKNVISINSNVIVATCRRKLRISTFLIWRGRGPGAFEGSVLPKTLDS